jgi:hypothetical protein
MMKYDTTISPRQCMKYDDNKAKANYL